jgi:hypothetical protein
MEAMTSVVPSAAPVTIPVLDTRATLESALNQETLSPSSDLPFASFTDACNCAVSPTKTFVLSGVTSTVATGETPPSLTALGLAHEAATTKQLSAKRERARMRCVLHERVVRRLGERGATTCAVAP